MKHLILAVLFAAVPVGAQTVYEEPSRPWRFFLSGGYPLALGVASHWTGGQYSVSGGFNFEPEEWPVGLQFDGMTHRFGFNDQAKAFAGSDGYMQMTAGTANVTWAPKVADKPQIKPRLIGGIGVYNRVLRTTEERFVAGTCFDPWWGYVPCAGTGTVVTDSNSQTKFGLNAGAAIGYLKSAVELFLQVRWHVAFTNNKETMFMPIEGGIRW